MKKSFKILSIILCLAVAVSILVGCSDAGAPDHDVSDEYIAVSTETLQNRMHDFMSDGRGDRTTYTAAEKSAAEYLQALLTGECGYDTKDVEIQDFSVVENNKINVTSQNVVAYYRAQAESVDTKNVIIGAYYDNRYASAYNGAQALKSEGALSNATGVVTLLSVAEYLQTEKPLLDFNVSIVFFGASAVSTTGAQRYYNGMSVSERDNTVLMIELQRLGVDHVYAYSDSRATRREAFFDEIAVKNGLDIYSVTQKSPIMTNVYSLKGIPYYQWAQGGVFRPFFNTGIPTLNLIGANWETSDMTDTESAAHANISFTEADTLDALERMHPDYADKMAVAATLVIRSLESDEFLATMRYDRDHFPNTDVLQKDWIWYLVVVCVVSATAAIMVLVRMYLTKKHPVSLSVEPQRNIKMAVFGMEYEDKNSDDIFIDINNSRTYDDEIFPGIPNNDSIDDIMPHMPYPPIVPYGPVAHSARESNREPENNSGDKSSPEPVDIFEYEAERSVVRPVSAEQETQAENESADAEKIDAEQTAPAEQDSVKQESVAAPQPQSKSKSSTAKKSAVAESSEKTIAAKKAGTTARRKTVSAGKSTHKSDDVEKAETTEKSEKKE